ncbi:MAG: ribose 5-phosphate isomerase B [Rhodothalassiaceae bacterium]
MPSKRIAVACDHAGYALKRRLVEVLRGEGWEVIDLGTDSPESVDYPDYGFAVAEAIAEGRAGRGLVICGTGIGISIAANRNPAVRAALCGDPVAARLARQHNDANVLALGARLIGDVMAEETLRAFLATDFEGGRQARRVDKLGRLHAAPVS